jgi:release factor glutamine methyltransferase
MNTTAQPVTLAQCLSQAQILGLARVDAQMVLLHCLRRPIHDRAWLLTHDTDVLTAAQHAAWQTGLQRRLSGEPVAYITGRKEFFGLTLQVDARVLDPRPDTETLVEWALAVLPTAPTANPLRILDLGTGSGAVALALQHARPDAQVWAVDASQEALTVARANAQQLNLPVHFIASDWFAQVDTHRAGLFDLIVSNPPYIAQADPHLSALQHEPLQALTSGVDGLDDLRHIIAQAPLHLKPSGWLLLEHGHDQARAVRNGLEQTGFAQVQTQTDLAGVDRCSGGQKPAK